jgi:hypothetical protein
LNPLHNLLTRELGILEVGEGHLRNDESPSNLLIVPHLFTVISVPRYSTCQMLPPWTLSLIGKKNVFALQASCITPPQQKAAAASSSSQVMLFWEGLFHFTLRTAVGLWPNQTPDKTQPHAI